MLSIKIVFIFSMLGGVFTPAQAQDNQLPKKKVSKTATPPPAESTAASSGATENPSNDSTESLHFNTSTTPPATDNRPTMTFSDPGAKPLGTPEQNFSDSIPDEQPYKSYLGYPKSRLGAYTDIMSLSSKWSYNGQDYNFTNTPIALGLNFTFMITPMWSLALDYSHYTVQLQKATLNPYVFHESSQSLDDYYFKLRYCIIGKSTFYRQFCPGLDLGNDAYPVLKFTSGKDLYMSKVQEIVVVPNLTYQEPFGGDHFMYKLMVGYLYGTGAGNSGALSSKSNSAVVGNMGIDYLIRKSLLSFAVEGQIRKAKLEGTTDKAHDTWTTNSTEIGFKLGYGYTFE